MAQDSVDVNTSSHNGCTALAAREQLTESQSMSSERHFGRLIGKGMQETLNNSIKSVACVRIEEPDTHARNYLEENHILRTLETLLTKLVYHQPEKPFEFLAKEMEQIKDGNPQKN